MSDSLRSLSVPRAFIHGDRIAITNATITAFVEASKLKLPMIRSMFAIRTPIMPCTIVLKVLHFALLLVKNKFHIIISFLPEDYK